MKALLTALMVLICVSCASSRKNKIMTGMAVSFVTGYAVGQSSAPEGENKNMHGALYGSALSALAGATLIHFFSESDELKKTKKRVIELSDQLEKRETNKRLISDGVPLERGEALPSEVKKLIKPGTWKLFEINEWVRQGNVLIHRDRELQFEPAQLKK